MKSNPLHKNLKTKDSTTQVSQMNLQIPFVLLIIFVVMQLSLTFTYNPTEMMPPALSEYQLQQQANIPFPILVRNTRIDLGWTRKQLAQKAALKLEHIVHIEDGHAMPVFEVEHKLRSILNLPTDDLDNKWARN